jgi:hypothetical protein
MFKNAQPGKENENYIPNIEACCADFKRWTVRKDFFASKLRIFYMAYDV